VGRLSAEAESAYFKEEKKMQQTKSRTGLALAAILLALALPAGATTVLQMNLEEMCNNAERIMRVTVLGSREGSIAAGGGEIPTIIYTFRVDEAFKGSFDAGKEEPTVEVQVLGTFKSISAGGAERLFNLADMPRFEIGHDYLILTTQPSAIGLSTTVGLNQGLFKVSGRPGEEVVVNGNDNVGLFRGLDAPGGQAAGPLPYSVLADEIRDIVGQ
jgi:hypothetical protein